MQGGKKNLESKKLIVSVVYVKTKHFGKKESQHECASKQLARKDILVLEKERIFKQNIRQGKRKRAAERDSDKQTKMVKKQNVSFCAKEMQKVNAKK